MTQEIRLEIKVRNNLILTRMEELGINTVAELCRRAQIASQGEVGGLISMKVSPLRAGSDPDVPVWKEVVLRISKTLLSEPEELFSENLREARIDPKTHLHLEISMNDLHRLGGQQQTQTI